MKHILKFACALSLLGACTELDISKPPIAVAPNNAANAVGLDVYARQRAAGNPVPRFRGQDTVSVRTYGNRKGDGYGEIGNAACTLDSGIYKAAFSTPANLVVPDYGPNSPAIFVQCAVGEKTRSITANAVNQTSQARTNTAAGAGLLGMLVIGVVNEVQRDNETDDFGYNPIRLEMRD